jgi:thiol-disulfide isomerase/thioredoxin
MRGIILLGLFVSLCACKTETKENSLDFTKLAYDKDVVKRIIEEDSVTIAIYDFEGFENFLKNKDAKTYVINFWATWCAPCVKELPYFEQLHEKYSEEGVEVILVSLDMPKMYESHLIPFLKKHNLQSSVIALDDPRQNTWIPKVDKKWSGAIPATYIYKKNNSRFIESSIEFKELENLTLKIKNSN